ncbi:uncharacterized protein LOC144557851 [Carex rostrata]
MAYRQRHNGWIRARNMFRNKKFAHLRSSSQIEPLLNDYLQSTDSPYARDYANGFEDSHKRNSGLDKKIDELLIKADDIKSKYIKIEKNYADDFEALNKKNSDLQKKIDELARKVEDLQSSNIENENKKKIAMEKMESENAICGAEIGKLKEEIAALQVKMIDTDARDAILKSLVSIGCKDIGDKKGLGSLDGVLIGVIVLIFLVCFLIGMHI